MSEQELISTEQQIVKKLFYYEDDGKINGPIEEDLFYRLVRNDNLLHQTLIWEVGDTSWKKLGETYRVKTPPPLPSSHIPNGIAITISIMPFLQMWGIKVIDQYFRQDLNTLNNYSSVLFGIVVFLYFFITINIFVLIDIFSLEKKNVKMGKAIYILGFLIPTYLFYRGTVLAKMYEKTWNISHVLAFVWIASANYAFNWKFF